MIFTKPVIEQFRARTFCRAGEDGWQCVALDFCYHAEDETELMIVVPAEPGPGTIIDAGVQYPSLLAHLRRAFGKELELPSRPEGYDGPVDRLLEPFKIDIHCRDGKHGLSWVKVALPEGLRRVHPITFTFKREFPDQLWAPKQRHDGPGELADYAAINQSIFIQLPEDPTEFDAAPWVKATYEACITVDLASAQGLVHKDMPLYHLKVEGREENKDFSIFDPGPEEQTHAESNGAP